MTIESDLFHDLEAPTFNPYAEIEAEKKREKLALEWVKYLVRAAYENNPDDHRTGCATKILRTIADVLIKEKGWTYRQAAEAMVMEGVRTGGYLERDAQVINRRKWKADKLAKKGGAK